MEEIKDILGSEEAKIFLSASDIEEAFTKSNIVFVTEDTMEAVRILQAGGNGVSVGIDGERTIESYNGAFPEWVYIVPAGVDIYAEEAARRIKGAFSRKGRDAAILHPPAGYDNIQALYDADEVFLKKLLKGHNWHEWERMTKAASRIDAFMEAVQGERYKPIKTGFTPFDRITGGGLTRQSLVMLAAAPGQGKTTLAAQLFEGMAKRGQQIIFVNLEMSREQLIAKSLSRHAYLMGYGDFSASDIMRGYEWTQEQAQAVHRAAQEYKKDIALNFLYADRDEVTAQLDSIMDYLRNAARHAALAGRDTPIVVIDYLHIIQTTDGRGREEDQAQAIKKSVIALKEFAIKYNTIVLAILATNREANRNKELTLYSGRDTSNIEYSADLFLTLQEDEEAASESEQKPLKLRVEKSRMGEVGKAATFYFDGKHGLFREAALDWIPDKRARIEPLETF